MKKTIALLLSAVLCIGIFVGCTAKQQYDDGNPSANADDSSQYSLKTMKYMPEFSCTDFEGNTVDNKIFEDYELTLVNLWGTWCGPCVAELPDLEEASQRLADKKVQIVGICEDGLSDTELAKEVLQEKGVTYTNIIPDKNLYDNFVSLCQTFPSCIVVNSKGEVVKNQFSGGRTTDEFVEILEDLLENGAEDNADNTEVLNDVSGLDGLYEKINAGYDKSEQEEGVDMTTMRSNTKLLKTYHELAYAYCGDSYMAVSNMTTSKNENITVKYFVSNGSVRYEEYHGDEIYYTEVFNNKNNTYDFMDVKAGSVDSVTKAREKGYARDLLAYGYFPVYSYNAPSGSIEDSTLDGLKVVFCEHIVDSFKSNVWIDYETGVMLKAEQSDIASNKVTFCEESTVTPNKEFDDSLFIFDEKKPDAGKDI